jgi:hypothetical protein
MTRTYYLLVQGWKFFLWFTRLDVLLARNAHRNRFLMWLRSLASFYDLADFIKLDLPWWSFKATTEVEAFILARSSCRVFEWGSGASTIWLARRSKSVVSIEHDSSWFEMLRPQIPANVELFLRCGTPTEDGNRYTFQSRKKGWKNLDFTLYASSIVGFKNKYDVIVIDGRVRNACMSAALRHINEGGIIILDNSQRYRYKSAFWEANSMGFTHTTYTGLTPGSPFPTSTTIFSRGR